MRLLLEHGPRLAGPVGGSSDDLGAASRCYQGCFVKFFGIKSGQFSAIWLLEDTSDGRLSATNPAVTKVLSTIKLHQCGGVQ